MPRIEGVPLPELQARGQVLAQTLRKRPDRKAVAALPPLMIAPAVAVEAALAGRRPVPKPGDPSRAIRRPRTGRTLGAGKAIASITGALTGMSRGDIARRLAFYRDPGCRAAVDTPCQSPGGSPASIGSATMLTDGTIVLQMRAGSDGVIGDAQIRYEPGDPRNKIVRKHLPELRVGTTVSVPPFE